MLSIIIVVKTKITIWAESIWWIQPFLFFFSKVLPDGNKKNDNIDNEDNGSLIPSQKLLSKVVQSCRQKKYDNIDNKRQRFFLFLHQKCCPRLSKVVVKKKYDNIDNKRQRFFNSFPK